MAKLKNDELRGGSRIAYACRRLAQRFSLDRTDEGIVEFVLADGSQWSVSLVVISENGLAFRLDHGRLPSAIGTQIDSVTIQVRGLRIAGRARIANITEELEGGTTYGVEFVPSEGDRWNLVSLITLLDVRDQRSA